MIIRNLVVGCIPLLLASNIFAPQCISFYNDPSAYYGSSAPRPANEIAILNNISETPDGCLSPINFVKLIGFAKNLEKEVIVPTKESTAPSKESTTPSKEGTAPSAEKEEKGPEKKPEENNDESMEISIPAYVKFVNKECPNLTCIKRTFMKFNVPKKEFSMETLQSLMKSQAPTFVTQNAMPQNTLPQNALPPTMGPPKAAQGFAVPGNQPAAPANNTPYFYGNRPISPSNVILRPLDNGCGVTNCLPNSYSQPNSYVQPTNYCQPNNYNNYNPVQISTNLMSQAYGCQSEPVNSEPECCGNAQPNDCSTNQANECPVDSCQSQTDECADSTQNDNCQESAVPQCSPQCNPTANQCVPQNNSVPQCNQINSPLISQCNPMDSPLNSQCNQINSPLISQCNQQNIPLINQCNPTNIPLVNTCGGMPLQRTAQNNNCPKVGMNPCNRNAGRVARVIPVRLNANNRKAVNRGSKNTSQNNKGSKNTGKNNSKNNSKNNGKKGKVKTAKANEIELKCKCKETPDGLKDCDCNKENDNEE
ncbi:hypothetical protein ENBRE01_2900 [Enteropsectra breve]|nr:hypothetical protein ENBRE01_2900 [Enteropsectra breve]